MPAPSAARHSPPCPLSLAEMMSSAPPSPALVNTGRDCHCRGTCLQQEVLLLPSFRLLSDGAPCSVLRPKKEGHIRHQTRKRTAMVQLQSCNQEQNLTHIKHSGHGHGLMQKLMFTVFLCAALSVTALN